MIDLGNLASGNVERVHVTALDTLPFHTTMSLPMLFAGGAECGPSNPLQGLSKRFDQDRGVQQVSHSHAVLPT